MAERELTRKQEAFALVYFETGNAAEAYRRAYDVEEPRDPHGVPKGYYVYVLMDPSCGTIFYVGKGKGARMYDHLKDFAAGKVSAVKKYRGIKSAIEQGRQVEPFCIEHGLSENAALRFERALILRIGHENLWNSLSGQTSADECAKAQAEAMIERLESAFPLYRIKELTAAKACIQELRQAIGVAEVNMGAS
ncbi:GIY-YIG nuclease family protein [Sulfitobacter dubius]|uniref:GIY-YIG domain-containing protein n=1 Tax=Sulfitobacter dubius TaxID=218673 RepID=A0ABY3ZIK7_9RHOB|nr:GIY-YIG nuclease family protein [Sulfitobacter dubius]UOA14509.1 hypothetical protein DSM109990_01315 [Sulfitobacter dubius]